MERVDIETLVIGAGVIGLACARALALTGREVWVLERTDLIGSEISSRNSEVIHAGIYYPANSLKAKLCVEGKALLYNYLQSRNLPYRRCGKLIVATDESQLDLLKVIQTKAIANGVEDLTFLNPEAVSQLESQLYCVGALQSPSTGIVDSHAYMASLKGEAENAGAQVLFKQTVKRLHSTHSGIELLVNEADGTPYLARAKEVVAACGLGGFGWLAASDVFPKSCLKPIHFAKGNYFSLQAKNPFSTLIYPVPEPGGLGVHLTMDMAGAARFGPDVEWVDSLNYQVSSERVNRFYDAIRKYWPDLPEASLMPDYSGIRPKITGVGEDAADFCIQTAAEHGVDRFINLTGIESPGLTASLAIADQVVSLF